MAEYLIRTVGAYDLPCLHRSQLAEVLVPAGFGCEHTAGWGDFRMRCGAAQVAFSAEEPGWQVTIDGPMPDDERQRLMDAITRQIGQATGQPL